MRNALFVFCLLMVSWVSLDPALATDAASGYYVPPNQFNASLQVMDLGFANIIGLFQTATSSFSFNEADKSISHVRIAIDATSLISSNAQSQNALAELLGVMQFPEIRIVAPDSVTFTDGKAEIKGTLMMHGASKPITLEAVLNHVGKSPRGGGMWSSEGDAVGLSLHGSFKRADLGMGDDPEATARFGDMMTFQLEMQALKQ